MQRNYIDILGGVLLIAFGAFVAIYSAMHYRLGTFTNMGPGMVPLGVGACIAVLGALIAILGVFKQGEPVDADLRAFLAVIGSLIGFGVTANYLGIVPAIFVLTFISGFAKKNFRLRRTALLSLCLSAIVVLVFQIGLGLPLESFKWFT